MSRLVFRHLFEIFIKIDCDATKKYLGTIIATLICKNRRNVMIRKLLLLIALVIVASCAKPKTPVSPSESNQLKIVSSCKLIGNPIDLTVDDSIIYVAEDQAGYALINTKNNILIYENNSISNVKLYKTQKLAVNASENEVFIYDNKGSSHRSNIYVADISNPQNPLLISTISDSTMNVTNLYAVDNNESNSGEYPTIIYWINWNIIHDVFNLNKGYFSKQNKYFATSFELPTFTPKSFTMDSNNLYIASNQLGIDIVNKDDAHRISLVNTPGEALAVIRYENLLYVADRQAGLQVIDVTDIQNPILLNDFAFDTIGYAQSLDIDSENNLLSVASGGGGVYVFHLNYPKKPELIGRLDSSQIGYTNITKIHKGKVLIGSRENGIVKISTED